MARRMGLLAVPLAQLCTSSPHQHLLILPCPCQPLGKDHISPSTKFYSYGPASSCVSKVLPNYEAWMITGLHAALCPMDVFVQQCCFALCKHSGQELYLLLQTPGHLCELTSCHRAQHRRHVLHWSE